MDGEFLERPVGALCWSVVLSVWLGTCEERFENMRYDANSADEIRCRTRNSCGLCFILSSMRPHRAVSRENDTTKNQGTLPPPLPYENRSYLGHFNFKKRHVCTQGNKCISDLSNLILKPVEGRSFAHPISWFSGSDEMSLDPGEMKLRRLLDYWPFCTRMGPVDR